MERLLGAATRMRRVQVTNIQAFLYTLPLVSIEFLILTIFSFVDPPRQTELLGVGDGLGVQETACSHESNAFFITQAVANGTYDCSFLFFTFPFFFGES
jgi:hypothetical protein